MLDFFTIFSKGGIVLFYFQSTNGLFLPSVNALIKSILLEERGGKGGFQHENLQLQYKLDNEFDLVFVVGYQKFLQLNYVDKFLNEIQLRFRDGYKNSLQMSSLGQYQNFESCYKDVLRGAEEEAREELAKPKAMKTFQDSDKSKKTVASLVQKKGDDGKKEKEKSKNAKTKQATVLVEKQAEYSTSPEDSPKAVATGAMSDDEIQKNREKLFGKRGGPTSPKAKPKNDTKKTKQARSWDHGGTQKDVTVLDFSNKNAAKQNGASDADEVDVSADQEVAEKHVRKIGVLIVTAKHCLKSETGRN